MQFGQMFDSGSSSSSSGSDPFFVDFGSGFPESNATNTFDITTQNGSVTNGIQINPTEYPKTSTDVYQTNMNYANRSTDVMRYV